MEATHQPIKTTTCSDPIQQVLELFEKWGAYDYIGEEVTQTEHMIQSAMLAESEGATEEEILGALFHDVGHLVTIQNIENQMGSLGQMGHENIGAHYLKQLGFSDTVCKLVCSHVGTKRYLVAKDKNYYHELSEASKQTLEYQGGPMNEDEMIEYEKDPLLSSYLKIRSWDDRAKIPDLPIKKISDYMTMMQNNFTKN